MTNGRKKMVDNAFGYLIEELGRTLEMPDLKADSQNSCLLRFPGEVDVYIELDKDGDHLLLGCDFGELPPGRYRQDLYEAALKCNQRPPPNHGILAYSKQARHLVLFKKVLMRDNLDSDTIVDTLMPFVAKAKRWKDAIANDTIPDITDVGATRDSGIFGLTP